LVVGSPGRARVPASGLEPGPRQPVWLRRDQAACPPDRRFGASPRADQQARLARPGPSAHRTVEQHRRLGPAPPLDAAWDRTAAVPQAPWPAANRLCEQGRNPLGPV